MDKKTVLMYAQRIWELNPLFLDTETTGLDEGSEVVEIALVDVNKGTLINERCKPKKSIPYAASKIHGITDDDVVDKPPFDKVWARIKEHLQERPVAIYNSAYDVRMISQSLNTTEPLFSRTFCIMKLYAEYYGEFQGKFSKPKWQSLTKALRQCEIEPSTSYKTHSAEGDCYSTISVLSYLNNKAKECEK